MTSPEPNTVGLDPDWIAANSVFDGQTPASAEFAGFIGTGQMSRNARFALDWADGAGPASVVVKVPSSDPNTRSGSFDHATYQNECEFYRSVAPLVDVAVPAALAVHYDGDAQDFAIVLEDLAGSEQGDQFSEPTNAQLLLALGQTAALQAPVWGDTSGPAFAHYRASGESLAGSFEAMLPAFVDTVFERLGENLDADLPAMLHRFGGVAGEWHRQVSEPVTLVHGDFRPDNFMFGVEAGAPALAIVDWQTLRLGVGATDIAYLLGGAVAPERRREIENGMLDRYVDNLAQRGVEYRMERCLADYAVGSLHGVAVAIFATSMADQSERGDALFTLMLNRHGRHALDLDALERLEQSSITDGEGQ